MKNAICILIILAAIPCRARTITVDDDGPADFNNIQAAIDDSNDGDTVLVADGTYMGEGNRDIGFHGKAITVKSENGAENCIIDCEGSWEEPHRGFYFTGGEGTDSIVEGFTITNGNVKGATWPHGGAIFLGEGSATIRDNIIMNNEAHSGGGIYSDCSSPIITRNIIEANQAARGGGIACESSAPIIELNTIGQNDAGGFGGIYCAHSQMILIGNTIISNYGDCGVGGIYCYDSSAEIVNNLIVANDAGDDLGGGIYSTESALTITNCTIAGNYPDAIRASGPATITNCIVWDHGQHAISAGLTVSYSNVEGGYEGVGNIDSDPCFFNPAGWLWPPHQAIDGDFHLKSQAGRWDPNSGTWVIDDVTSPCIDAGDPMSPIGAEPFPNGGRINMGAYGGTAEASKSYFGKPPCEAIMAGDVNGDCIIDFRDLCIMALHWCENWQE